jgi:hypothetical protein
MSGAAFLNYAGQAGQLILLRRALSQAGFGNVSATITGWFTYTLVIEANAYGVWNPNNVWWVLVRAIQAVNFYPRDASWRLLSSPVTYQQVYSAPKESRQTVVNPLI